MTCYHPIPIHYDPRNYYGARATLWPGPDKHNMSIPCGKCLGCRTARALAWSWRCMHEASLWEHNIFLTLTYDDDHLPENGHLEPEHLRNFWKKLRIATERQPQHFTHSGTPRLRYFACGEYGTSTQRPHYHAIVFNCDLTDTRKVGKDLRESDLLANIWAAGQHRIGTVTGASANYIAQYSIKKIGVNYADKPPPFLRMSNRPGIGYGWLLKYEKDLQHGYLINNGQHHAIPRYYKIKQKEHNPLLYEQQIQPRINDHINSTTTDQNERNRLKAQEIIHKRYKQLTEKRNI